jgi:DNA-binding response OmpR family regulator
MPRELALNAIWGSNDYFNGRSMDVFISKIRKHLKADDNIQIINIHGVGFKLAVK